MAQNRARTDI